MKLTVLQQDLLPGVQAVARSSGIKSTLPVLANILLQTDNGVLKLHGTNLELGVVKTVACEIIDEGDITVPARTFLEIVSSLSGSKITLETSADQLNIATSTFHATINGISATEFPSIPLSSEKSIFVSSKVLQSSLPEIAFAAASDEGRPILTGILTEIKNNTLELVATDGFRLAHKTTSLSESTDQTFRSLIPRKTFEEVVRLMNEDLPKGEEQNVEIATSENQNQIIFTIGSTKLSSRLIEGQFPSWEKIIPSTILTTATVDRGEFLKAVKLSSVFARGDNANIIKLHTYTNKIELSSETRELGTQQSEVEATIEGEEITIAFNAKFLIEALQSTNASDISLEFSGNLSAALMKPVGETGLEYVIMPVRLS